MNSRRRRCAFALLSAAVCLLAPMTGFGQDTQSGDSLVPGSHPEVRYDGKSVVRVWPANEKQMNQALALSENLWSERLIPTGPIDFMLDAESLPLLEDIGIRWQLLIEDVQPLIDAQKDRSVPQGDDWYSQYKTFAEVSAYADQLVADYPTLAQRIDFGTSLEGRSLFAIRISNPATGGEGNPSILLNGCQHAREWIAVMVPMYIIENFLAGYDTNPDIERLVNRVNLIVVPVTNPDGYVYSWDSQRMWRKNRRNNGGGSYGVDLNRNWSKFWGGNGSSGNRNSETYRGPSAFSEPETSALRDFILSDPSIVSHIDIHSYSQLVLYPWDAIASDPPDLATLDGLSRIMAAQIKSVHNETYRVMMGYDLYPAAGTAMDWTYGVEGILSFTIELRDKGWYGFLLPPDKILPTCEENFAAVTGLADQFSQLTLDVDPLFAGQPTTMRIYQADPNEMVYVVYSLTGEGSVYVPVLDVVLDVSSPKLVGSDQADANGYAEVTAFVPNNTPLILVWFQAAQYQNVSNVVLTQVN
ncbi:MAG: hypothetical protein D8M59_08425 [Planctomycetes bacterium]|nr:hypothetical protein [Planctomycetota bacterium]NOG53980.1 hypothetical protein [Planctomycetota bacterium]